MSSKDLDDGLTDKQRAAFDKYTDLCTKSFDKLASQMQMGCADHLATLRIMDKQKHAQQDMLAQVGLLQTRVEEIVIVNDWISRWQTQSAAMISAFMKASFTYDMILGLKSSRPIDYAVMLELAICLLPEIKPCQKIFRWLLSGKKASRDTIDALAQIGITVKDRYPEYVLRQIIPGYVKPTPEALNLLDRRSKDLTNIARGAAHRSSGNVLDEASVRLKSSYHAKNQIFDEIIGRLVEALLAATAAAPDFNQRILSANTKDPTLLNISKAELLAETIKNDPGKVLTAEQYELLANQILYQMLRAYMQKYGDILQWGYDGGPNWQWLPTSTTADGLDKKAPDEIFELFNSRNWKGDSKYPPIDSFEDMIAKWKLPVRKIYPNDTLTNAI
jgi:hypothetical protein